MEWQNPIVPWWVWHRYSSHPSSDNDHANFLDMLISMDVCYSIFNIQTYHVGMNYGKLESMVAWKYLWYSDENNHYWYQSGRNPLMKSLAILVASCYVSFLKVLCQCGLGNSRVIHHPAATSLTFTKKMQNTVFDVLFSKSLPLSQNLQYTWG